MLFFFTLSSVVVCNAAGRRACGRSGARRAGRVPVQRPTLHGGPVRLRPARVTPCYIPMRLLSTAAPNIRVGGKNAIFDQYHGNYTWQGRRPIVTIWNANRKSRMTHLKWWHCWGPWESCKGHFGYWQVPHDQCRKMWHVSHIQICSQRSKAMRHLLILHCNIQPDELFEVSRRQISPIP